MDVDVVVVGAGTAGANAAYQLALRGLSVVLLDRRPVDEAGAQWHNGVLDWQFERAGLEPPKPPVRHHSAGAFHMFAPTGRHVFTITDPPTVTADMSLLGRQLRSMCAQHGVVLIDRIGDLTTDYEGDRLTGVRFVGHRVEDVPGTDAPVGSAGAGTSGQESEAGRRYAITARLFVDASGRTGVLRRSSPTLQEWCPTVRNDELCSASDYRFAIVDRRGAEDFLERHGALPGDRVNTVGLAGGYSTRNITVAEDLEQVSILVGCISNGRYGTGPRMLESVRRSEPWIGEPLDGGSGVIPLRRPYARFTAPGLALVGDSASQVFPAHGSGIGMGLIAGRILAEVTDPGGDIGDGTRLWRYQHAFMNEFGGLLAAFDAFRRMSTALGSRGVSELMEAGLVNDEMTRAGLDQRLATPDPSQIPVMAARLVRRPRLAARVLPMLARVQILRSLGGRHPETADLDALLRWDRMVQRVLGPLPS